MADLDLTQIATTRASLANALTDERVALAAQEEALRERAVALARGDAAGAKKAQARADAAAKGRASAIREASDARSRIGALSDGILAARTPEDAVATLTGDVPVLLLPARLETRFAESAQRLDVRIFPDQIHVTAHDPAVTSDELGGLTWYWQHRWPARDDTTLADEAWTGLTSRFRPGRAAFLVRAYPPTNLAAGGAQPQFPSIPQRASQQAAPPRAALLPDRWCVLGYQLDVNGEPVEAFRVWGSTVPDTLVAGPGSTPSAPTTPGGMPEDPGLAWLSSPKAAAEVGMLVTVRQSDCQPGHLLANGVDRLLALGVDWTLSPQQAADAVAAHLQSHADEGRLAFVPQGSPTNSTGEQRSAFSTDPAVARTQVAPHRVVTLAPGAAATLTGTGLGLPSGLLDHLPGADLREGAWQQALLTSLWSATGGYFLTEMMDPELADPVIEAAVRRHAAAHLRPAGPLPILRVGSQPYGVLPVVHRTRYQPSVRTRAEADVHRVAETLRTMVTPWVRSVPRLASVRAREDVDDVMLALLTRTPVPWSLTFRQVLGPVQRAAIGVYWAKQSAYQRSITAILMAQLGVTTLPLLSELTQDGADHPLDMPLVLRVEGSGTGTGYLGEIVELLGRKDGRTILDGWQSATALLEAMLTCSAVREIDRAAKRTAKDAAPGLALSTEFVARLSVAADRLPYSLRIERTAAAPASPGGTTPVPRTPTELSRLVIPALTGSLTLSELVAQRFAVTDRFRVADLPDDPLANLAAMSLALETLGQAPPDQLEWAFRATLDLFATRLDAWITSLATARLQAHRSDGVAGVHVGGWAAVEDLHPDVGPAAESLGYVHAPSLGQAASLAVLRSARLSHVDEEGRIFDLDLSSQRVRHALRILEGVASGQRLAALLGYRFERMLQDRDLTLAGWILPLRLQCPLRSDRPDDPDGIPETQPWSGGGQTEPVESVAAREVVDGVALLARWATEGVGLLTAAGVTAGAQTAVGAVLDDLAGLADSVSDVLVSEAVHQATTGNLVRAGAALAAHDRQGPAPEAQFVRTPRAGHTVAHRVGVWLDADATEPATGWTADIRSAAEPRLDRWIGAVLGDPADWKVGGRIVHTDPGDPAALPPVAASTNVVATPDPVGVDDLGLSALSVVVAAGRPGAGQRSELEALLAEALAAPVRAQGALTANDRIELDEDLTELLDRARWAADLLAARSMGPADLADATDLSGTPTRAAATDATEAIKRAEAVTDALTRLLKALDTQWVALAAEPGDPRQIERLASAMRDLATAAGADAIPAPDRSGIADQAKRLSTLVSARLSAIAALPPAAAPSGTSALETPVEDPGVSRARTAVRAALGEAQPFLPVLTPTDPPALSTTLTARSELLGKDETALVTWLHSSALVRPALDSLACLLLGAEVSGAAVPDDLRLLQLPHQVGRAWLAAPFAIDPQTQEPLVPLPGTVGIVLHAPDGLDPSRGGSGVLVDAWNETIPLAQETTAVAFQYDAPGARAPQTMLLAVHPDPDPKRWDMDALVGSVHEALDLARLRTLGPKELAPLATFLPALFLPDGTSHDTPGIHLVETLKNVAASGRVGLIADHVRGKGASDA